MLRTVTLMVLLFCFQALAQGEPSFDIAREKAPFPGYLYRPADNKPRPAILLLHGSEGGNADFWYLPNNKPSQVGENAIIPFLARYYASLGYVAYALCYFDCRHHEGYAKYPPEDLKNIELMQVTYPALKWLKESPLVNGKVLIWGGSRGAEQALLLASKLAELKLKDGSIVLPDAVVALSPLEEVASSFPLEAATAIINGHPLPPLPNDPAWLINGEKQWPTRTIEIAKFKNPVLVSSFEHDPVWSRVNMKILRDQYPSSKLVNVTMAPHESAVETLKKVPPSFGAATFIEFTGEGHVFPPLGSERSNFLHEVLSRFFKDSVQ